MSTATLSKESIYKKIARVLRNPQKRAGYLFILPAVLVITIFVIIPCAMAIILSFTQYDLGSPPFFVGLRNYREALSDPKNLHAFKITAYYVVGSVPTTVVISLFVALVLNEKWFLGRDFWRTIYFLPTVVSMVAVAFVWQWVLNPQFGTLNRFLEIFNIPPQQFLGDPKLAMPTVIMISVWRGIGFNLVIYLAGLQGISESYYEAARIDGAAKWQQVRYITLPLLSPTTFFLVIMGIIGGFQVFEAVYLLTGGGPGDATRVIIYYIWQQAFRFIRMGYASAISVLLFIIILAITMFQWRYYRQDIEL